MKRHTRHPLMGLDIDDETYSSSANGIRPWWRDMLVICSERL